MEGREEHRGIVEDGFLQAVKNIKDNRILKISYLLVTGGEKGI